MDVLNFFYENEISKSLAESLGPLTSKKVNFATEMPNSSINISIPNRVSQPKTQRAIKKKSTIFR